MNIVLDTKKHIWEFYLLPQSEDKKSQRQITDEMTIWVWATQWPMYLYPILCCVKSSENGHVIV